MSPSKLVRDKIAHPIRASGRVLKVLVLVVLPPEFNVWLGMQLAALLRSCYV